MGTLTSGPLSDLARSMAQGFGLKHFVETGTFLGHSSEWAADVFEQVTTVESNEDYHVQARARLAGRNNVTLIHDDSVLALKDVVPTLDGPALFWLDAHAGGGWFGGADYCPLLGELEAIAQSPFQHVILIDDARAFLAPPPPPYKAECWPGLSEVILAANTRFRYDVTCLCDALICTPPSVRPLVVAFSALVRPAIDSQTGRPVVA